MGLDVRLPIGLLFAVEGVLLTGYGLFADPAIYARSLGHNVNLVWGVVLLVFGLACLYFARRGSATVRPAETTPEGRAMEARERVSGIEGAEN